MGNVYFRKPDGEIVRTPEASEDAALKAGYQYATEEEANSLDESLALDAEEQKLKQEAESKPLLGGLEAVARGVTFGFSPRVLGGIGQAAAVLNKTFLEPVIPDTLEKDFRPEAIKAREEYLGLAGTGIELISGIPNLANIPKIIAKGAAYATTKLIGKEIAQSAGEEVAKIVGKEISEKTITENAKKTLFAEMAEEKLKDAGWRINLGTRLASYIKPVTQAAGYGALQGTGDYISDTYLEGKEATMEGAVAATTVGGLLGGTIGIALPAGFDTVKQTLKGVTKLFGAAGEFAIPKIGGIYAAEASDLEKAMGIGTDIKIKGPDGNEIKLTPQEIRTAIPRSKIEQEKFIAETAKKIETKEFNEAKSKLKEIGNDFGLMLEKVESPEVTTQIKEAFKASLPTATDVEIDNLFQAALKNLKETQPKINEINDLLKKDVKQILSNPEDNNKFTKLLDDFEKIGDNKIAKEEYEKIREGIGEIKTNKDAFDQLYNINKIRSEIGLDPIDSKIVAEAVNTGLSAGAGFLAHALDFTYGQAGLITAAVKTFIDPLGTIKIFSGIERSSKKAQMSLASAADSLISSEYILQNIARVPSQTKSIEETRAKVEKSLESLNLFTNDPDRLSATLAKAYGDLDKVNPTLSNKLQQNNIKAMQFLDTVRPKQPANWQSLQEWKPSDQQIKTYNRYLNTVENPGSFLEDIIKQGYITEESMAVMNNVYPEVLEDIRSDLMEKLADAKAEGKKIPARKLELIRKILGTNTSSDQASLKRNQEVMQLPVSKGPTGNVSKAPDRELTQTQRLSR